MNILGPFRGFTPGPRLFLLARVVLHDDPGGVARYEDEWGDNADEIPKVCPGVEKHSEHSTVKHSRIRRQQPLEDFFRGLTRRNFTTELFHSQNSSRNNRIEWKRSSKVGGRGEGKALPSQRHECTNLEDSFLEIKYESVPGGA